MAEGFDVKSLSQDLVEKNMRRERAKLVEKWDKTPLLKGLTDTRRKYLLWLP